MSKVQKAVSRKDADDHMHNVAKGDKSASFNTGGMCKKPSTNSRAGFHTHLFEHDGDTHETDPAFNEPGHVHDTEFGLTGAPLPLDKDPGVAMGRTE